MAALNEGFWPSKYDDHAGALDKLRSGVHGSMKPSLRRLPSDGRACLRPSFLINKRSSFVWGHRIDWFHPVNRAAPANKVVQANLSKNEASQTG